MNDFKNIRSAVITRLFIVILAAIGFGFVVAWFGFAASNDVQKILIFSIGGLGLILSSWWIANLLSSKIMQPLENVWKALAHVSEDHPGLGAPNLDQVNFGRIIITKMVQQIYQLASATSKITSNQNSDSSKPINPALMTLPVPVVIIDSAGKISFINDFAKKYFLASTDKPLFGQNVNEALNLMFSGGETLEQWLKDNQQKTITATKTWQRVRVSDKDGLTLHQGDLVGYFNKALSSEIQASLVFFDQSERYDNQDKEIDFVALVVHELRTPLTVMRGYIEVIEEELAGTLGPEMAGFMEKLKSSSEQLTAFVGNILNVARVEENQLTLHLEEHSWPGILKAACSDMEMRAKVHGKQFEYHIDENVPKVAVDKISIYEVITNLLDNAIKYSGEQNIIIISSSLNKEGMVETTVQDFGSGVPSGVMPHLFDKFYRNHRSRDKIGGTGLGLFLSKAILEAHGGQIWVRSKENEGSIFGFSLQKYQNVSSSIKNHSTMGTDNITRNAHGWIKNHSLYRR